MRPRSGCGTCEATLACVCGCTGGAATDDRPGDAAGAGAVRGHEHLAGAAGGRGPGADGCGAGAGVMLNRAVPARISRLIDVESGLNDGIATPFVLVALAGAGTAAHEPGI